MNVNEKLKSTSKQIQIICDYLLNECNHDEHLAKRIMLENKTLDLMYKYIMATVKKNYTLIDSGVMVSDTDVYSMAIHYFIEEDSDLKIETPKEKVKKVKAKEIEETDEDDEDEPDDEPDGEEIEEEEVKPIKAAKLKKPKIETFSLFDLGDE